MGKIALTIYSDRDFGGAERRLIRIYNELGKSKNCDLIIRGENSLEKFKIRLKKSDCDISNINEIKLFKYSLSALIYLIFTDNYNVIHFFDIGERFNYVLSWFMKKKGVKTLLTIAFQNYAYGLMDKKTKQKLSKLLDISTAIDVLYPKGVTYLKSICSNREIYLTPGTFTNLEIFYPQKKKKIILFAAARLEIDKNAKMLIEASNICRDDIRRNDYLVMICGRGGEEAYLRKLIENYKIDDIVKMPGYVKVSEIFPSAELFISIDLIDNYPAQNVAEAVASGCSLICTDVGASRMCGDGTFTSFIGVKSDDLAKAIVDYMNKSDEEKIVMKNHAREYALKNYSINRSVEYFDKIISNL